MNRIVVFIPIRKGSKKIPNKNIRTIASKPLVMHVAETAAKCKQIDMVYVASDSRDYLSTVWLLRTNRKIWPIDRHESTATDDATSESALIEFARNYEFNHVIFMQATSPIVTMKDIEGGLNLYFSEHYDSVLSVARMKKFVWAEHKDRGIPLNYKPYNRPRRQEWDGFLVENGAFFITSKSNLLESQCRVSGKIGLYQMPDVSALEIDSYADWIMAEEILKHMSYQRRD